MAIVGVARPISSKLDIDGDFHRKYVSVYEVITNDRTDGPGLITTASGLPSFQSSYVWYNSFDDTCFCDGYSIDLPTLHDTAKKWKVTVTHSTPKESSSGAARQAATGNGLTERGNPVNEPWEVSLSYMQYQRPVTRDKDNKQLANTVEEPYIPAIEIDQSRPAVSLKKNTNTLSLENWSSFQHTVNSNPMWGLQARQIMLSNWSARVLYYGLGQAYVENNLEFHISFEKDDAGQTIGWTHLILNQGFRKLVDSTKTTPETKYAKIHMQDHPSSKPFLLDADGNTIVFASTPPVYNQHKIYLEKDFSQLGLPDPLPGGVFT